MHTYNTHQRDVMLAGLQTTEYRTLHLHIIYCIPPRYYTRCMLRYSSILLGPLHPKKRHPSPPSTPTQHHQSSLLIAKYVIMLIVRFFDDFEIIVLYGESICSSILSITYCLPFLRSNDIRRTAVVVVVYSA